MKKPASLLALTGALAAGLAATVVLTGCSVVDELVYHQRSATYASAAEAADAQLGAAWIPADATEIRVTRTTDATAGTAAVLLDSDDDLDPAVCAPVARQSAPAYAIEDAPDAYTATDAFACGEWTVIAADGGWLGWSPNHPDEAAQSPQP